MRVSPIFITIVVISLAPRVSGLSAWATITTDGSLTGTGTPYNGTDDPWVPTNLTVR